MEKIISIINKKLDELEEDCKEQEVYYQKLKEAADGLKKGSILIEYDDSQFYEPVETLMRMHICTELKKDYNKELLEETTFFNKIVKKINGSDILDILDCLDDVLRQAYLDSILDLFKNNKILLDFSNNSKKVGNIIELSAKIIELKSLVAACKFPMVDVLEYMRKCNDTEIIMETICYGGCLLNANEDIATAQEYLLIKFCTEKIMANSYELVHKAKLDLTNSRRQVQAHKEILNFLEKNKGKKEITDIPKQYKKLDSDVQYQLVKSIYEHNMLYNKDIEKEYIKSSQDSIRKRQQLLQKYKINSDDLFLEYEIEELESISKSMSEMKIIGDESICDIIKNIDIDKLETVQSQYKLGYIDSDFVSKNIGIIGTDDNAYKNVIFNLRKLKGYKVSKKTITNCSEILISDSKVISNNLSLIDTYLYKESLKDADSIEFLKSTNLKDKLDIMIELGFEDNISNDLSLLNYNDDKYKRLIVLKRLNLLSGESNEIRAVLEKDKFIIPDNIIDEYILDLSSYGIDSNNNISKDEFLERLGKYQVSNRAYEIDDVKISKFKIDRLLDTVDSLTDEKQYKVLSHGKKLDSFEYQALVGFIKGKNSVNQKIKIDGKNC